LTPETGPHYSPLAASANTIRKATILPQIPLSASYSTGSAGSPRSFYVPFARQTLGLGTYWLVGGFFSWIIAPWTLAVFMTADLIQTLPLYSLLLFHCVSPHQPDIPVA